MSGTAALSPAAELARRWLDDGGKESLGELFRLAVSPDPAVAAEASQAIFRGVVEPLGDRFEPALCDRYIEFFSELIERCRRLDRPEGRRLDAALARLGLTSSAAIAGRALKLRAPRRFTAEPARVRMCFVLSRVTLGADVAVTSVVLGHLQRAFPEAELIFAGGAKAAAFFAAAARFRLLEAPYPRAGGLLDRLNAWTGLRESIEAGCEGLSPDEFLIVDPDSRLTQLGLLPLTREDQSYYFFESRSYQAPGKNSLAGLTSHWMQTVFPSDETAVLPWVALDREEEQVGRAVRAVTGGPLAAVNLGVGGNPAKRVRDPFEQALLEALLEKGYRLVLDRGAGQEEFSRTARLLEALESRGKRIGAAGADFCRGGDVIPWQGSLSGFAALIQAADVYAGYDSAGSHLAAAVGTPGVSIFHAAPSSRMIERWRPVGKGRVEAAAFEPGDAPEDAVRTVAEMLP